MALAMREGVLPRTLHVDAPSSKVDWETGEIELLTEQAPWEGNGRPRRAGVSSFGISGTNAHVILEEAPAEEPSAGEPGKDGHGGGASATWPLPGPILLTISAKAEPALGQAAERLAAHLQENPDLDPIDVAHSLATTRSALEHRAVVLGADRDELLASLGALADSQPSPNVLSARAKDGKLAYLFTGQGSQRLDMGRELHESDPHFQGAFDAVCEQLDRHLEVSLKETVFAEGKKAIAQLEDTACAQPALFAIEVALYKGLAERGLYPDMLAGHSIGEIAAAHLSGVLDLPDAAKLVAARGRLMSALPAGGAMAAIEATETEVAESIEGKEQELAIAAINGPASTVISGVKQAVEAVRAEWEESERKTKRLAVSHAFHSPLMEPMLEEFAEIAATLTYSEPTVPIVSNVTGELLSAEQATDPAYWVRHAREPVRFADAVATLAEQGVGTYLELGPDPVLCAMARECLGDDEQAAFVPTLRESRPEAGAISTAIAHAHAAGAKLDWAAFFAGTGARRVSLPTYPFQRRRYWMDSALNGGGDASAIGQSNPEHPLLAAAIEDPGNGGLLLTGRLSLATHPWLADHAVGGTVLLPGTALLELALRAAEQVGAQGIDELTLQAPLILLEPGAVAIQVSVSGPGEDGRREIAIHSRSEAADGQWGQNASGFLSEQPAATPDALDSWPPPGAEPVEVDDLYDRLAEHGLEYGPAFQGLTAAWREGERIYAEASLPEEMAHEAERYGIHPALLDAALHGIGLAAAEGSGELRLPFSWSGVSLQMQGARELRVKIEPGAEGEVSLSLADGAGAPLAVVGSLVSRPLDPSRLQLPSRGAKGLLGLEWAEVELAEVDTVATEAELLRCEVEAGVGVAEAARKAAQSALGAVQRWLADESKSQARLALITKGAVAAGDGESPDPAAAAVWGLVRSAQSEHPGRFALIDGDGTAASEAALPAALALGAEEPQLALRERTALAARAMPATDTEHSLIPPSAPWRLDALERGTLESLALIPSAEAPLGPTEVRVRVHAAGLNFRDVLVALGLYPGEAVIGGEGAGVVVETGSEVTDLAPGARVLGMFPNAFGPLATAERDVLVPVPEGWSFEQAAAMPIVFATAYFGLRDLAGLQRGEKVLIHAGAGGVGMAAIGIARHLGAEVFATASPGKWDVLRELGLDDDHIASSRELDFEAKFLETTAGGGVDVVLNALAGEFVDASLALLPRGGRFLEMGKTDIRDPERVATDRPGVAYRAFDVTEAGPVRSGEILAAIVELFERGALRHSPIATWDIRRAPQAFRQLREGRNVGKLVLALPRAIDPERTVLITGATGGLGALTARHLVERHGARHLLLLSRSGAEAEGAAELLAELEALGAETTIAACDVSDREALERRLDSIPEEHPLGAVIHCAGVLADGTVESLGDEQIERVFAPKVDAAWNLHELTEGLDLSAFVLFSSAAGTMGGPGQANYAAANVFLDALAQRRQAAGLAGVSIAWGLWEREGGMAGGLDEADLARMRRGGIEALSDEQGLALFDAALRADRPQALAVPVDVAGLGDLAASGALPPILSGLARAPKRRSSASGSLVAKLAALPEGEHEAFVLDLVRGEVAAVLGYASVQEVEPGRAFQEMGFDSLAAVELRNRLNAATGLGLGATTVFDHPTPAALAGHLRALTERDAKPSVAAGLNQLELMLAVLPAGDPGRSKLASHLRSLAADLESDGRAEAGSADLDRLESASDEELLEYIDEQVGSA
jgi:NADPH:quinone reductase-like Zn-dependent oxidoreductase